MYYRFICFALFFLSSFKILSGQDSLFLSKQNIEWNTLKKTVLKKYGIRIYHENDTVFNKNVIISKDSTLLDDLLSNYLKLTNVKISKDSQGNFFLFKDFTLKNFNFDSLLTTSTIQYSNQEKPKNQIETYKDYGIETITIGKNGEKKTKDKVKLYGVLRNNFDNSPIPFVNLIVENTNLFTTSNAEGYYELLLYPGNYTIISSGLGLYEKKLKVNLLSSGDLNITLNTKSILLEETVISTSKNHNIKSTNMGFEKISSITTKSIPTVMGEQDVIKIALLLPGVQTVSEVSSGFNVRGSPSDQNMFYIDNLPIYNAMHLFGFFTAFNSDAINEFNFYKGNIPVEYGDQLSSIFSIFSKKGNAKNFSARGGIGIASSRFIFEGPLKKEKSSFLFSLRSTYSDWILNRIDNPEINTSSASFNDALLNVSFELNPKNNISILLYRSKDYTNLSFGIKNSYENLGSSIRYSHSFSRRFTSEIILSSTKYAFSEENSEVKYLASKSSFWISQSELKTTFKYFLKNHTLQGGINSKYYYLKNGDYLPTSNESLLLPIKFEPEKALNNSIFVGDLWDIQNSISIEGGIRLTNYSYLGPKTVYLYEENQPRETSNIVDTVFYDRKGPIKKYNDVDYRLSAKYEINTNTSVKLSYNRLHQYTFMLSNSIAVSPTDKWKLSDINLKPMQGDQLSFGFYKNFMKDKIVSSVEIYYKKVENLVEYKDGANFVASKTPEANIIQGNLKAYGVELMIKKREGVINGWVNYTYSRSLINAYSKETGESNNRGYTYAANYDKPHTLNLTLNYKLSRRFSVSSNVVYSTGRPITYPTSIYYQDNMQMIGFSKRNAYRLPDYFRVDLAINIEGNFKKSKLIHGSWSFSLYNVTGRKNPYSIIFENVNGEIKGYKISVFGTIIPSITYNWKFGNYEN